MIYNLKIFNKKFLTKLKKILKYIIYNMSNPKDILNSLELPSYVLQSTNIENDTITFKLKSPEKNKKSNLKITISNNIEKSTQNSINNATKFLSNRGYGIIKESISNLQLKEIKNELTVSPNLGINFGIPAVKYKIYQESVSKIYIPKWYGLQKFGIPDVNKLNYGKDINIEFCGTLRDSQKAPVKAIIDACNDPLHMGGMLHLPCAAGKTVMGIYVICTLKKKTLIIVHKDFLLEQWKERIMQFAPDARLGTIKAKVIDVDNKDIVIASLQSLAMKNYNPDIFKDFGMMLSDECLPYKQCIATENGPMYIGKIYNHWEKGEELPKVLSFNNETQKMEYKKITYAWRKTNINLLEISFSKSNLKCTTNHRVLTIDGYKEASELKIGDLLLANYNNNLQENMTARMLNSDQYQIMLGSFLGDGHISKTPSERYRLKIIHSKNQKKYCEWKAFMFGVNIKKIENNGYSENTAYEFTTKLFDLKSEKTFPKNKYTCPQWILDELDARGLAIWWMDDGNLEKNWLYGRLSTCSFDEDTHIRIIKKLKTMGINSFYKKDAKGYFTIYFNQDGMYSLLKIIQPYMHPNIEYKFQNEFLKIAYNQYYNGNINTIYSHIYNINPSIIEIDTIFTVINKKKEVQYSLKNCNKCDCATLHVKQSNIINNNNYYRWRCGIHDLKWKKNIDSKEPPTINKLYEWNNKFLEYGTLRISKINNVINKSNANYVYDIEVEDNHNFIACSSSSGIGPIVHNCHHLAAEIFSQALQKVNFQFSIGLSATINRKDGLTKVFRYHIGDIVYSIKQRTDVAQVSLRQFIDNNPEYNTECQNYNGRVNMPKMINNICNYLPRTQFIIDIIKEIIEQDNNRKILLLSDRRNHLEKLNNMLNIEEIDNGLYYGSLKQEILKECEDRQVILGTYAIASEGLDISGLNTLILASPKTDIIQSVGRILRDIPEKRLCTPLIIDIQDMFSIFISQSKKREKYYKQCKYEILKKDEQCKYEILKDNEQQDNQITDYMFRN